MKLTLILINIAAAAFITWAGRQVCQIHRGDSVGVVMDLYSRHLLATPQKGGNAGESAAANEQLEVLQRVQSIGALGKTIPILTYSAAAIFLFNAAAFFGLWKKKSAEPSPSC